MMRGDPSGNSEEKPEHRKPACAIKSRYFAHLAFVFIIVYVYIYVYIYCTNIFQNVVSDMQSNKSETEENTT